MSQNESGTIAIPMYDKDDAVLVLEDGQVYVGEPYGALGETTGEIVFATGMTGYQETLTDPSYDRQIVVQTFPHIGDTGVNSEDPESSRIWVAGYIVRDPSPNVSNWRAEGSLDDDLAKNGIVGLSHIDTRKLVRHLRSAGVMRAGIFSGDALTDQATGALKTIEQLLEDVKNTPQMQGLSLYDEVSTKETYTIEPCGEYEGKEPLYTVAAVDLGIKGMTPHRMAERGCRVHVVPSTITFAEIENLNPDGVFFSNGPGDPEQAGPEIELLRQVLDAGYPFFGICFGNQLLGRALGFGTYKLKFGHRSINQPVKDLTTGKVEVTAHNHGFAVDAPIGKQVDAPFENGKYGKAIISNSKIKIVLGMEPQEAKCVQEVLQLTKSELRSIINFDRGEGLICANNNKVPVFIRASALEEELITTDPEQLKNIVNQRKKEQQQSSLAERLTGQPSRSQPRESGVEYTGTPPTNVERSEFVVQKSAEEKKVDEDARMGVWAMEQLQAAEVNEPVPGEARASFDRNHLVRVEEPDDDFISQINAAEPNFDAVQSNMYAPSNMGNQDEDLANAAPIDANMSAQNTGEKGDIVYGNHPPVEF